MKILLLIFLCCFSISVNAAYYGRTFNVTGTNDMGNEVGGIILSNDGDPYVRGTIFDADGNPHSFQGRWNGIGQITGSTEEDDSINLQSFQ